MLVLTAAATLAVCLPAGARAATLAPPRGALQTAVVDPEVFASPAAATGFARTRAAGSNFVLLSLYWNEVAPAVRPAGFDPANPADPGYDWQRFDIQVAGAVKAGLQPMVVVFQAPGWAENNPGLEGPNGTLQPDFHQFALFAKAAATRYAGGFLALPRVRYWEAWNEPNIGLFLNPQFVAGRPFTPGLYRRMVNAFAASVKSVHRDNLVIAGGTAPFRDNEPRVMAVDKDWGPLSFMRDLLCLSASLRPTCHDPVRFDIWAHHPYTSGGPTHHAVLPNDVSLADLPEMRRVLAAGVAAGNVVSPQPVGFWVTEFSWDSSPPDPKGVPAALEARWVSEGLYRMWTSGVSLVTWFLVRDEDLTQGYYQSGLYYRGASIGKDRPKPALQAFRFPLAAFKARGGVLVWLRTPGGTRGRVALEQQVRGRWHRVGVVGTNSNGIFDAVLRLPATGAIRGRLLGSSRLTLPFGLRPVADRFFNPFGLPVLLEPGKR